MHTGSHEAAIDIDGIDIDGEDATNVSCSFLFVGQVSEELIRVAILWGEQWHGALEQAYRRYFFLEEHGVDLMGMRRILFLELRQTAKKENVSVESKLWRIFRDFDGDRDG